MGSRVAGLTDRRSVSYSGCELHPTGAARRLYRWKIRMTARSLRNSLLGYKASADDELLTALQALDVDPTCEAQHSAVRVLDHAHRVARIFAANLQRRPHG